MVQMNAPKTVDISPNLNDAKGTISCQCELGREKLLTAPPYKQVINTEDDAKSRLQTAPCVRDLDQYKCPISHIFVTFKSPVKPKETFTKVFPATTPVKLVKRKISKLLDVSVDNILLTKNRNVLKESTLISDLKTDPFGNLIIDVFTKDSEEFSLSSIPKESYVDELFHAMVPKKRSLPFITIKFKVNAQNEMFTRPYHSIMKVHEMKKNLGEVLQVDPDNLVLLRGNNPLIDRMSLLDLDYDDYGVVELDLWTKNNELLNLNKLYKEVPYNDVLQVTVPLGSTIKNINVEIFSELMKKPFLGGYRNVNTGIVYHHAYTQTPQKPEKVLPENKNSRDTQTAEMREKIYDTSYSRAIQMDCVHAYIPNVTDRIVVPRPYETYEEKIARLNHNYYATIIQRAYRHYQFRKKVTRWLQVCMDRIARMKEEEGLEQEAMEKRLRKDLVTKTFPRNREDFDQLYAMVDRWKHAEITRISQLHSQGPKIAEFSLLLDKEVELLRCIESYRVKVKEDSRQIKEKQFLEEISKPIAWYGRDGKLISMDTVEIQRARKLKELYNSFLRTDMQTNERIELLVDMKFALQGFQHALAEEIIDLLDRECDLLIRRYTDHQLEYLRRRTAACVLQFIKTSELNSGVTKCKDLREYRKMENSKLYLCEMCHQVKSYTQFPINTRMSGFLVCTSCSWKDVSERYWIDMTPYKFILRAIQRDERKRKCWGSLAFVLQEKDVFFIVEKLWHSHSAISECNDITQLRLCRWHVKEDWSPWNCFLITVQEMKAHIRLENPELVYDEELVNKVINKHKLAKGAFEQLLTVNKRYTESGDWQNVRATATDRLDAVERI